MNSPAISLLLVASALVSGADGFLWSRSSRSSTNQLSNSFSTNNCMCLHKLFQMLGGLGGGGGGGGGAGGAGGAGGLLQALGKREVADLLELEEDYPGLEEFMEHADVKRDGVLEVHEFKRAVRQAASTNGMVDKRDFVDAVKKKPSHNSQHNSPNLCHCGRAIVDQFNFEL